MKFLVRIHPLSVQIYSCKVASSVTVDDSIWVEHWDNLEDKVVSEKSGTKTGAYKVVNYAFNHKGGSSLSRVNPR